MGSTKQGTIFNVIRWGFTTKGPLWFWVYIADRLVIEWLPKE